MKITFFLRKGQWYWRMTARNGKIIAVGGEGYERLHKCAAAVFSVIQFNGDVCIHERKADPPVRREEGRFVFVHDVIRAAHQG